MRCWFANTTLHAVLNEDDTYMLLFLIENSKSITDIKHIIFFSQYFLHWCHIVLHIYKYDAYIIYTVRCSTHRLHGVFKQMWASIHIEGAFIQCRRSPSHCIYNISISEVLYENWGKWTDERKKNTHITGACMSTWAHRCVFNPHIALHIYNVPNSIKANFAQRIVCLSIYTIFLGRFHGISCCLLHFLFVATFQFGMVLECRWVLSSAFNLS